MRTQGKSARKRSFDFHCVLGRTVQRNIVFLPLLGSSRKKSKVLVTKGKRLILLRLVLSQWRCSCLLSLSCIGNHETNLLYSFVLLLSFLRLSSFLYFIQQFVCLLHILCTRSFGGGNYVIDSLCFFCFNVFLSEAALILLLCSIKFPSHSTNKDKRKINK